MENLGQKTAVMSLAGNFSAVETLSTGGPIVLSDDRLIDDTLEGRAEAFGQLVARYQDRLFNAMVRITGCHAEAEDVVQDAFVQAFLKLDRFKRESQFFTWLYRIAMNTSISRHRKKRPSSSLDGHPASRSVEPVAAEQPVGADLERQEQQEELENALQQLPLDQRQILVLRELDNQSYEDIAVILELPIGTVRSRLHRARKQLHTLLKTKCEQFF